MVSGFHAIHTRACTCTQYAARISVTCNENTNLMLSFEASSDHLQARAFRSIRPVARVISPLPTFFASKRFNFPNHVRISRTFTKKNVNVTVFPCLECASRKLVSKFRSPIEARAFRSIRYVAFVISSRFFVWN